MNAYDERWQLRLARVRDLRSDSPNVPALTFYHQVLKFQAELASQFQQGLDPGVSLREQVDVSALSSHVGALLRLSTEHGPELLRVESRQLSGEGKEKWHGILQTALASLSSPTDAVADFIARACLQPVAENLQVQSKRETHYIGSVCPVCGGIPQLAVLKPEGEGASRSLLCSFCLYEWPFRRVICAWCGEEDKERLPRYSSDESPYVHVDACDTCKHYLKAIDLSVNGLAVPLVDEAAMAVLDVWATERGYTKIIRNLIGF